MKKIIVISLFLISCNKNNDCSTKEAALKIAETEFIKNYGDKIKLHKPFTIEVLNDSIWSISGKTIYDLGGVPTLKYNKNNCKIFDISHGK